MHARCPWVGLNGPSVPRSLTYPLSRPLTRARASSHYPQAGVTIDGRGARTTRARLHLPAPPLTVQHLLPRQNEGCYSLRSRLRSRVRQQQADKASVSFLGTKADRLSCWQRRAQEARQQVKRHGIMRSVAGNRRARRLTCRGCAHFLCFLSLMPVDERRCERSLLQSGTCR